MPDPSAESQSDSGRLLGQTIGPYKILSLLAVGKRAQVYLAQHIVMGRKCAFKATPPRVSMTDKNIERFRREIRITASLQHPNIIEFYDAGKYKSGKYTDEELIYLVMECFDGMDLAKRFAGTPAPIDVTVAVGTQVASALVAAHEQGIVHREIEPDNILMSNDGWIKVVDFGIAKAYEKSAGGEITDPMDLLGSPSFMAPEQAWAPDRITPQADIYGLGALLYFCLTGRPPYEGDQPMEIIQQLGAPPPSVAVLRPDVPEILRDLVERAMAKDPDDRFLNAESLYQELANISLDTDAGTKSPQPADHTPTPNAQILLKGFAPASRIETKEGKGQRAIAYLRIFGPVDGCWEYRLEDKKMTIGRNPDCDVVLSDNAVSRHHASLYPGEDEQHLIEDNQSRAGLVVNGETVERATLRPGDTIQIAHYILQYRRDAKHVSDEIRHFPLNFLPTSMEARYRLVYFPPGRIFETGDTLPIGRGGIYVPVEVAPVEDVCAEVELAWPNGKKRTFLAEILGTLPSDGKLLLCLKLHLIDKERYERVVKRSRRGPWATAPKM